MDVPRAPGLGCTPGPGWLRATPATGWLHWVQLPAVLLLVVLLATVTPSRVASTPAARRARAVACAFDTRVGQRTRRGPSSWTEPAGRRRGWEARSCSCWRRARHRDLDRERTRARDVPTPCQIAADRGQPRLRLVGAARATRYADGFRGSRRPGDAVCDGCSFLIQALSQQLLPSNPLQRQPLQWPAFCQR